MELKGKIIQELAPQSGMGKKGPWKKQEYIIETQSQYPKKVAISVWNDNVEKFDLWVGDLVTLGIEPESREYNNKWYTEIRAWKCEKNGSTRTAGQAREERKQESRPSAGEPQMPDTSASDDLPFKHRPYVRQY